MGIETLTDEIIAQLLNCPKRVENPQAREKQEGKQLKRDYRIVSDDGWPSLRLVHTAKHHNCGGLQRRAAVAFKNRGGCDAAALQWQ